MQRLAIVTVVLVGLVGAGSGWAHAQNRGSQASSLTPQDYAELQHLALRLNQGADFHDSQLWVSQWTPDGIWTSTNGREHVGHDGLKEYRRTRRAEVGGRSDIRHWTNGLVLTPTAGGATGLSYYMILDVTTTPPKPIASGHYEDVFARTPDGWRIKHRIIRAYPLSDEGGGQ